jgi:hypothetical protein
MMEASSLSLAASFSLIWTRTKVMFSFKVFAHWTRDGLAAHACLSCGKEAQDKETNGQQVSHLLLQLAMCALAQR